MSFSIGDRVVCVDDSMQPEIIQELKKNVPNWVKKYNEYTVRAILTNRGIATGILVEEIDNPILYFDLIGGFQEPAFADWRFRKLKPTENMVEVVEQVREMV